MNFQQIEETVEQYDPQGSVIRSQQLQEERSSETSGMGAVSGMRSTQQPVNSAVQETPVAASSASIIKQNETTSYEVSKAVRHIVNPVGVVERISVAVIIDNVTKTTSSPGGQTQTTSEPRNPEEMRKYRDLVAAAIAINPERGDQLIVENISFDTEVEAVEAPTFLEKNAPIILTGLRYMVIPVVFLFLYILFLRPVQKTVLANWAPAGERKARTLPRPDRLQTPLTVKQLEAQLARSGGSLDKDGYADTHERELLPSPTRMDVIRKRVVDQAKQDPETMARLVRTWLSEEKNK
jgi:flagellar M-ring protein FliF